MEREGEAYRKESSSSSSETEGRLRGVVVELNSGLVSISGFGLVLDAPLESLLSLPLSLDSAAGMVDCSWLFEG